jgi:Trk K+ transport system NAD-binding subunit
VWAEGCPHEETDDSPMTINWNAPGGHIVVFGFHGVARRIVRQLTTAGQYVVVVESDATPAEREAMRRYGAHYLEGFRQSEETLDDARVGEAHAVICAFNDDVRNIEIALLVRRRSPDVRIVVQMANASVGRALRPIAQPGAVLEVAELAAPSFVETAINRRTHSLDLGGREFLVSSHTARRDGTFRSIWGDLAPIALTRADEAQTVSCPRRDDLVHAGDEVTLMGTMQDFAAVGLTPSRQQGAPAIGRTLKRRIREGVAASMDLVDRPLKITVTILGTLAVISVVLLLAAYREVDGSKMSLIDAAYFTAETIATVGFGDYYFRDQEIWLRIWAIVVILLGASLIAIATALLTNALVSRSLAQSLGRQRVTGMHGHVVVIGLGAVGSRVATELHEAGYEVAIIDSGEGQRFVPQMRTAGIPVLIGDATLPETLADAGVQRAAGVAVLTSDDLVNIDTGLAVRDAVGDPDVPIVLRLFGHNLAREVGAYLDVGIPRSIADLSAPWFVGAALGLEVLGTFYVGAAPFMAAGLTVRPGGRLDGIDLAGLGDRMRVVAVQRADTSDVEYPPRRDTVLHAGDRAYLVGHHEVLFDVLQRA